MTDPTSSERTRRPPTARRRLPDALFALALRTTLVFALVGCDPDVAQREPEPDVPDVPNVPDVQAPVTGEPDAQLPPVTDTAQPPMPTPTPGQPPTEPPIQPPGQDPDPDSPDAAANGFALALPDAPLRLVEGAAEPLELAVTVKRTGGHSRPVTLAAIEDGVSGDGLLWRFAEDRLEGDATETTLAVSLPIGPLPRMPESRRLRLVATDGSGSSVDDEILFETEPTDRPDIYLLAGQSNMVGSTLEDVRMIGPGEPDAPDPRIFQLDVTTNDRQRFPNASAYTDIDRIAVPDRRIVQALDPLHDTRDRGKDTKSGTTIGLGLSFAKAALANTTADIVLVPAAWSDTGFCLRDTGRFDGGTGWNATRPAAEDFAGTLLHDRAIARTDLTIAETGGILRGILWHQGEADSDNPVCARAYGDNLREMVASLRSNIAPDARGDAARGSDAPIPFIVATMSKGDDPRAKPFAPGGQFPEPKSIVDGVHRNVASVVPLSGVVDADDLVPEAFPCGQGSCIHFGAEALREFGTRYYRQLLAVFGIG